MSKENSSSKKQAEEAAGSEPVKSDSYRVLARKYRPEHFDDLIGQHALVQTLSNAFEAGRIAQAYMLTGVRGVGKTTTARLIARGLNYDTEKGVDGPSLNFAEEGVHCRAILESRHMDVLEMDAASHTGIDDVREIIDSVRYAPASARFKVYIIDEVHMLSRQAFNGLLKTLEEPPPHVKFIFATTEIRKVPVTVLSRCQRFDLRRVDADVLSAHFAKIAAAENISIEDEALKAIVRASEGSVRDGLSLLDQAIAHGDGSVETDQVENMLGLSDRSRIADLAEYCFSGDIKAALAEMGEQFDFGADPGLLLSDLAAYVHALTKAKIIGEDALIDYASDEQQQLMALAEKLSLRSLARAWQILLKGLDEVGMSHNPMAAAEMVLIRFCYSADLPTMDELIRQKQNEPARSSQTPHPASAPSDTAPAQSVSQEIPKPTGMVQTEAAPATSAIALDIGDSSQFAPGGPQLANFADIVALAREKRDIQLCHELQHNVRLVKFDQGHIEISLEKGAKSSIPNELARKLEQWTGQRWIIALSKQTGAATLAEAEAKAKQERILGVTSEPIVKATLETFPGAEIVDVSDAIKLDMDD